MRRGERPATLAGQLGPFLAVPDNVIGVVQNRDLLHRLDAAFFRVGEARGGLLVKFHGGERETPEEEMRDELERNGLPVRRLEVGGRMRFSAERSPLGERGEALEALAAEAGGRTVWASFNWTGSVDLEAALEQQEAFAGVVEARELVVKTAVLEEVLEDWPPETQRRARETHSGTLWLSGAGLSLSRLTPLPPV